LAEKKNYREVISKIEEACGVELTEEEIRVMLALPEEMIEEEFKRLIMKRVEPFLKAMKKDKEVN